VRFALSARAEHALLGAIAESIRDGTLRLFNGEPPGSANEVTTQEPLAALSFTRVAVAGGQVSADIEQEIAAASGQASWARVSDREGNPIFDCDVGGDREGAVVTLNTTQIRKGGPVTIRSFSVGLRR
jgi:hypothetical protein